MSAGGGSTDIRGSCKTIQCSLAIAAGGGGGGMDSVHGFTYRGGDAGYPSGSPGGVAVAGNDALTPMTPPSNTLVYILSSGRVAVVHNLEILSNTPMTPSNTLVYIFSYSFLHTLSYLPSL